MSTFHPLRVAAVDRLTDDAVALTFAVPPELRETYGYAPGQHIALRRHRPQEGGRRRAPRSGARTRSAPPPRRTARRRCASAYGGSRAATSPPTRSRSWRPGDTVDVLPPTGRFVLEPRPGHFAAVVGGSGITPVLSIASTLLAREPDARFCLIRSDRSTASTMFLEEVADLKDRFPDRFQLVTVLSREEQQSGLPSGRLDEERLRGLLPVAAARRRRSTAGSCAARSAWSRARRGRCAGSACRGPASTRRSSMSRRPRGDRAAGTETSTPGGPPRRAAVTATLDGRSGCWPMDDGESVLETVLRNRADAPFACKGGVCGTCRVRLVSGEVRMDRNFALEPDELDAGYVLACQSHPVTERRRGGLRRLTVELLPPRSQTPGRPRLDRRPQSTYALSASPVSGRPAASQASMPPSTLTASTPCCRRYWVT